MRAVGFTRAEARSLVRRELLFPAYAGTFFLIANPPRIAVWTAAVARCGDTALLSHFSAAALWNLWRDEGWPQVTAPRGAIKPVRGIVVHQTRQVPERAERSLIPCTTLERTIDDCARRLAPAGIVRLLRQAEYHHDLDLTTLAPTSAKLKCVLEVYVPGEGRTHSELEADFFVISHNAGLPTPVPQRAAPGGRCDFVYEDLRLIVEVDGYDAHKGRVAFREDRARDRANAARGYVTLRFTWEDVELTPAEVGADLASVASRLSMVSSTAS